MLPNKQKKCTMRLELNGAFFRMCATHALLAGSERGRFGPFHGSTKRTASGRFYRI